MYKNNSDSNKAGKREKLKKVTSDKVGGSDSLGSKMVGGFVKDDCNNIIDYVIMDVLIPMVKEGIIKSVTGALSMLFYGDPISKSGGKISYNSVGTASIKKERIRSSKRTVEDYNKFNSRYDAAKVLNSLRDRISDCDLATVADFFDLVGVSSEFTDNNYGWTNLDSAYITEARGGYVLNLPTVKFLE